MYMYKVQQLLLTTSVYNILVSIHEHKHYGYEENIPMQELGVRTGGLIFEGGT